MDRADNAHWLRLSKHSRHRSSITLNTSSPFASNSPSESSRHSSMNGSAATLAKEALPSIPKRSVRRGTISPDPFVGWLEAPAILYPRALSMRIVLLATTLVLLALGGELVLRYLFRLGTIVWRVHEDYLHEHLPGSRKLFIHHPRNGGDWVRVSINDAGFRGDRLDVPAMDDRILVYGDSFVAAEFTPLANTFVIQLGDRLSELTGNPYEMINAGVSAYGPDQIAKRMTRDIAELKPRAVVLAVTAANDSGDLIRNKLYALGPRGSIQARRFEISPRLRRNLERQRHTELGWVRLARAVQRAIPQRIEAMRQGRDPRPRPVVTTLLERCEADMNDAASPTVSNLFTDQYDADVSFRPRSAAARSKRQLMSAVLGLIGEQVREAGIPLLLVAIPSPIDITEDHFGLVVDWSDHPDYRRTTLTDAIAEAGRIHEIETVDLYAPFRENDPESLYFSFGNDHWNSRGQALAAEIVAPRLAKLIGD